MTKQVIINLDDVKKGSVEVNYRGVFYFRDGAEYTRFDGRDLPIEESLHRIDGPAAVYAGTGQQYWFKDGLKHRENGPAWESPEGEWCWYFEGKKHRIDGPALKTFYSLQWWLNDELHSLEGPAVIDMTGHEEFWIHGKPYTEDEFAAHKKSLGRFTK